MKLKWFSFPTKRISPKQMLPPFLHRETSISSRRRNDKMISSPLQEIQDSIQAERNRLDSIKKQLAAEDYGGALRSLMRDTSEDLHYFNAVKNKADPRHSKAFRERHGMLIDFTYPKDKIPPKDCIWIGLHGYRNKKYRCHNKSLVCDGKELSFCSYHATWCINKSNHLDVPVKITCPNEAALCNECFACRHGHAPKQLRRIPGTRKI